MAPAPNRLSLPSAEEDPYKEFRHLPAVAQWDAIEASDRRRQKRSRKLAKLARNPPAIVPRRKPLPPDVPLAQGAPLATRLTTPPPRVGIKKPLISRLTHNPNERQTAIWGGPLALPDFTHKSHAEDAAILRTSAYAVVRRLQALFDRKHLLNTLDYPTKLALQEAVDRFEGLAYFCEDPTRRTWTSVEFYQAHDACKCIGNVPFYSLGKRYLEIVQEIVKLVVYGRKIEWAKRTKPVA